MSTHTHKFKAMLEIQEGLNKIVDVNWKDRDFRFEDAMMVEAVELFDHLPWKWWKKSSGQVDYSQAKLEGIDIWHFLLSRLIQESGEEAALALLEKAFDRHDEDVAVDLNPQVIRSSTRYLIADIAAVNVGTNTNITSYLASFVTLISDLGMTVDELYTTYIAKTELNKLRWANGYGTTYVKIWDGQEDNVWLSAYVETLDVNSPTFREKVAEGLQKQYAWVTRPKLEQDAA
jgi:dimeric dUTPase (all-alpha-NTP-PPase superfamily)